jgi:signal transduction histidine kinase
MVSLSNRHQAVSVSETSAIAMSLGDVALLLGRVAAAPDLASALADLRTLVPRCLSGQTRIDLLVEEEGGTRLALSTGVDLRPGVRCAVEDLRAHLVSAGYLAVLALPLDGPRERLGWLMVSNPLNLETETSTVAVQIAAMLTMRLSYERCLADLHIQAAQAATLQRRMRSTDEVRLRATLAAGAAHDIGNLFASVMGHVQLIQQQAPESLMRDLQTVEQAARDGHHLLRRVITARMPESEATMQPVADVARVINDAVRLTQPFWKGKPAITIVTELPELPEVSIHPAELREVLINLIINGVAAMQEGGIMTIRANQVERDVAIAVTDTGVGIDLGLQGAIFQPAGSTRESGAGLGLSASRAVVEEYGGTIEVASAIGQGATFTIRLMSAR